MAKCSLHSYKYETFPAISNNNLSNTEEILILQQVWTLKTNQNSCNFICRYFFKIMYLCVATGFFSCHMKHYHDHVNEKWTLPLPEGEIIKYVPQNIKKHMLKVVSKQFKVFGEKKVCYFYFFRVQETDKKLWTLNIDNFKYFVTVSLWTTMVKFI